MYFILFINCAFKAFVIQKLPTNLKHAEIKADVTKNEDLAYFSVGAIHLLFKA